MNTQQQAGEQQPQQPKDRIPAGMYEVRGIEGSDQIGEASTGTEQVVIDVEIVNGPLPNGDPELKGQTMQTVMPFTDKAMPYSLERIRLMGWEGGDSFAGIGKNIVKAIVKYEIFDGRRNMKVDIYTGGGRIVMETQMNDTQKRAFFAKLNKVAKQEAGGAKAGGAGYPKDWDSNAAPPGKPPVVDL